MHRRLGGTISLSHSTGRCSSKRTFSTPTTPSTVPNPTQNNQSRLILPFVFGIVNLLAVAGFCYKIEDDTEFSKSLEQYISVDGFRNVGKVIKGYVNPVVKEEKKTDGSVVVAKETPVIKQPTYRVGIQSMRDVLTKTKTLFNINSNNNGTDIQKEGESIITEEFESFTEELKEIAEDILSFAKKMFKKSVVLTPLTSLLMEASIAQVLSEQIFDDNSISKPLIDGVKEDIKKQSMGIKSELETIMLKSLEEGESATLKERLQSMSSSVLDKMTWESIRLRRIIQQTEMDLETQYLALVETQKQELEIERITSLLVLEEKALEQAVVLGDKLLKSHLMRFNDTIKAQAEGFQNALTDTLVSNQTTLKAELQTQMDEQMEVVLTSHASHLENVNSKLSILRADIALLEAAAESVVTAGDLALKSHGLSSAILSLETALSASVLVTPPSKSSKGKVSVKDQINQLRTLCQGHVLFIQALDSIPERVIKNGGSSLKELQMRFSVMRDEVRKVALAPTSEYVPNALLGQVMGDILATFSIKPKGYVTGQGLEEVLSRTAYFVERGKLKEALRELNAGVDKESYAAKLMTDWMARAEERVLIDRLTLTLKAVATLKHKAQVS